MQWPYEDWGATAVFAGHDHVYERIIRADGNGDGNDFAYFTTGAGGKSLYDFGTPLEGSQVRCGSGGASNGTVSNCYGSMIIDANSTSITFEYWSVEGGGTLVDTYTIGTRQGPRRKPRLSRKVSMDTPALRIPSFKKKMLRMRLTVPMTGLNGIVTIQTAQSSSRTWA